MLAGMCGWMGFIRLTSMKSEAYHTASCSSARVLRHCPVVVFHIRLHTVITSPTAGDR